MKLQKISYELALELDKKLDFKIFPFNYASYNTSTQQLVNADVVSIPESLGKGCLPDLELVQKWLREKHNIFVICTQEFYSDGINYLVQVFKYTPEKERCYEGTMLYGDNAEFKTYEYSLEFGLKLALELI
jgi:hypothetical protein